MAAAPPAASRPAADGPDAPGRAPGTPMGARARSDEQQAEELPPEVPRLRTVICFRLGVLALTLWAILKLGQALLQEGEWAFVAIIAFPYLSGVLFVSFGLPSLLIAVGLLRRSPSAIKLALGHDLLIVAVSILATLKFIASLHHADGYEWEPLGVLKMCSPGVGFGLAFAAEAACLLRAARKWRPAWGVFALLAIGMVSTVTIVPQVLWASLERDVQPLLTYVNAHWVKITPATRLALGQRASDAGYHTDNISIRGEDVIWHLSAEHGPDGRWTFPMTMDRTPTFSGSPAPPALWVEVASQDEAKMLLLRGGVADTDLRPERVTRYAFWFQSPLGQGRYRVYEDGRIEFFVDYPLEVP